MQPDADRLYRYIQGMFFRSDDNWDEDHISLPDGQQRESVVNDMVEKYFGGYRRSTTITIGSKLYYCRAYPPQNKLTRGSRQYNAQSKGHVGQSMVNINIYDAATQGSMHSIHIDLRRLGSEQRDIWAAEKQKFNEGGWATVKGKRR